MYYVSFWGNGFDYFEEEFDTLDEAMGYAIDKEDNGYISVMITDEWGNEIEE